MLYALRSSSTILVMRFIEWWLPVRENCRPAYFNSYEAKSLQLTLTACYLAHTVLNIWSYLRLPSACYPVADLPCRDGNHTRWNNRPCSAALSLYIYRQTSIWHYLNTDNQELIIFLPRYTFQINVTLAKLVIVCRRKDKGSTRVAQLMNFRSNDTTDCCRHIADSQHK